MDSAMSVVRVITFNMYPLYNVYTCMSGGVRDMWNMNRNLERSGYNKRDNKIGGE